MYLTQLNIAQLDFSVKIYLKSKKLSGANPCQVKTNSTLEDINQFTILRVYLSNWESLWFYWAPVTETRWIWSAVVHWFCYKSASGESSMRLSSWFWCPNAFQAYMALYASEKISRDKENLDSSQCPSKPVIWWTSCVTFGSRKSLVPSL